MTITGDERSRQLYAVLLGTAVGDSVGLPAEGLRRRRIESLGWGMPWRQRLVCGRGMCSDDTEHTVMVLQSLIDAGGDVERFRVCLARRLRWWVLGIPAGVGFATLRAALRLWVGINPRRSGVYSAGNGPAMRSAVIGAFFADDPGRRAGFVEAATLMTHADPKALIGAQAIAELAALGVADPLLALPRLRQLGAGECGDWRRLMDALESACTRGDPVDEFARAIGGAEAVSGYVYETVPVAIYAWLHHGADGEGAISAVLGCGGDADTVGAITGALCAASRGTGPLPERWVSGIAEWPRGIGFLKELADCRCAPAPRVFWAYILLRNLAFLVLVLSHGLLRCVPGGLRLIR